MAGTIFLISRTPFRLPLSQHGQRIDNFVLLGPAPSLCPPRVSGLDSLLPNEGKILPHPPLGLVFRAPMLRPTARNTPLFFSSPCFLFEAHERLPAPFPSALSSKRCPQSPSLTPSVPRIPVPSPPQSSPFPFFHLRNLSVLTLFHSLLIARTLSPNSKMVFVPATPAFSVSSASNDNDHRLIAAFTSFLFPLTRRLTAQPRSS